MVRRKSFGAAIRRGNSRPGSPIALLAVGKIKPVVAERIPLIEAAKAHALLERGGYAVKVVLVSDGY